MFASGRKWKTRKVMVPSPFPATLWIVSVCQRKYREKNRKEMKERKKKNTDRTQTKLNAPHVRYNVKILAQ